MEQDTQPRLSFEDFPNELRFMIFIQLSSVNAGIKALSVCRSWKTTLLSSEAEVIWKAITLRCLGGRLPECGYSKYARPRITSAICSTHSWRLFCLRSYKSFLARRRRAKLLLQNPNDKNKGFRIVDTALNWVVAGGHIHLLRLLVSEFNLLDPVERQSSEHPFNVVRSPLLHIAAAEGHISVVEYLLQCGFLVKTEATLGKLHGTALEMAVLNNQTQTFEFLLHGGLHVEDLSPHLLFCAAGSNAVIFNSLLNAMYFHEGTETMAVDFINPKGKTLLHLAVENNRLEIVKILVSDRFQEDPLLPFAEGVPQTAVDYACRAGSIEMLRLFLHHPNPEKRKRVKEYLMESVIGTRLNLISPLGYAARNGHVHVVKFLLEQCETPLTQLGHTGGVNMLWHAIDRQHSAVLEYLFHSPGELGVQRRKKCQQMLWQTVDNLKVIANPAFHLALLRYLQRSAFRVTGYENARYQRKFYVKDLDKRAERVYQLCCEDLYQDNPEQFVADAAKCLADARHALLPDVIYSGGLRRKEGEWEANRIILIIEDIRRRLNRPERELVNFDAISPYSQFTLIDFAIREPTIPLLIYLIMQGADVNQRCYLVRAAEVYVNVPIEISKLNAWKKKYGWKFPESQLDEGKWKGKMPLQIAIIKLLLEAGADVNMRDSWMDTTPIFHARTVKVLEYLLLHGADPNAKDRNGRGVGTWLARRLTPGFMSCLVAYGYQP